MSAMDHGGLLVRRPGQKWVEPQVVAYDNEAHLQSLLAGDPDRIPGVSAEAFSVRELDTAAGPIDVCVVDVDGTITVVECKLAASTERRRTVIGQVIDYAAAIWRGGDEQFLSGWTRRGTDLRERLAPDSLDALRRNIQSATVNLCLAVDRIDDDLRRLVEYLNVVTSDRTQVTAVQLGYARDGDLEILIPSTYGGELAAAKAHRAGTSEAWTWDSFRNALSDSDREIADRLVRDLEALDERRGTHDLLWFGRRPGGGVFLHPYGLRYAPIQLWINSAGQLAVIGLWNNYSGIAGHGGFADLASLLGQDHRSASRNVAARAVEIEALWSTAIQCAIAINAE